MSNKIKLLDFINSDKSFLKDSGYTYIINRNFIDNLHLIQHLYGNFLKTSDNCRGEFIVDVERKTLYTASSRSTVEWYSKFDIKDFRLVIIDELKESLAKELNEKILEIVGETIDYNSVMIDTEYSKSECIKLAINGIRETSPHCIFGSHHNSIIENAISLLKENDLILNLTAYDKDKEKYLENTSNELIKDSGIYDLAVHSLAISNYKNKILNEIYYDDKIIFKRKMVNTFSKDNGATVNVLYGDLNTNGEFIFMKFKVPTGKYNYTDNYISDYDICNAKEREAFRKTYGKTANIEVDKIIEVTYGKSVLYKK